MSLLNHSAVRQFIMDFSARSNKKHTRVAEDIFDVLEGKVRDLCRYYVSVSPGKTVSLVTGKRSHDDEAKES